MVTHIKSKIIKLSFFGGLIIVLMSLFVDWYYYEVRTAGGLIAQWSFQLIMGWHSSFIEGIDTNEILRPTDSIEPLTLSILLMGMIMVCGYGTLMKDVEITNSVKKSEPYTYLNVFLLMFLVYFIAILPCTFLFPQNMYVPFIIIEDIQKATTSYYCIGPAYLMQGAAFVLMVPYVIMSVITMISFRSEQEAPERKVQEKLEESKEEIPIDKFIAELSVKSPMKKTNEADLIYAQFQQHRRRKQNR